MNDFLKGYLAGWAVTIIVELIVIGCILLLR